MSCALLYRLLILVIHLIYRLCLLILCLGTDHALLCRYLSDIGTIVCLIGDALGNDILCSGNRIGRCRHLLLLRNITLCQRFQRLLCLLCKDQLCKRLEATFLCDHRTRPAFRAIRTVKILQSYHCHGILDLLFQLRRQFFLITDRRKHLVFLFLQIAQITQALIEVTKYLII